jgi:hypothetical protein
MALQHGLKSEQGENFREVLDRPDSVWKDAQAEAIPYKHHRTNSRG